MPEGIFCKREPITTAEGIKHLLSDKGGKQYYEEMKHLEVDVDRLRHDLETTCKSRTRTWLDMCAHCGMCAESCFLYVANKEGTGDLGCGLGERELESVLRATILGQNVKGQCATKNISGPKKNLPSICLDSDPVTRT